MPPALTTALAGPIEVAPAGALSGELNATGPLTELREMGCGRRASRQWRQSLAVAASRSPGETRLQLADGRWRIESHHRAGNTVPIALVAGGALDDTTIGNSTVAGRLDVAEINVVLLLQLLRTVGIANVDEALVSAGTASATARLAGRVATPTIEADIHALGVAGMAFTVGEIRASASGQPATPRLTFTADVPSAMVAEQQLARVRLAGRLDGNVLAIQTASASQAVESGQLSASGTYDLRTERYDATLDLRPLERRSNGRSTACRATRRDVHGRRLVERAARHGLVARDEPVVGRNVTGRSRCRRAARWPAANVDARAPELNSRLTARVNVRAPYQTRALTSVVTTSISRN